MSNKQPFYHRAVVLFTATREISAKEFTEVLRKALPKEFGRDILKTSIEAEECDVDPGDPADLM